MSACGPWAGSVIPFAGPPGLPVPPGSAASGPSAPGSTRVLSSCFVATLPRSGSWLLAEALANTGLVGVPNEYFRPDFTRMWSQEWGLEDDASYARYVETAKTLTATANGIFSAKLHWYQFAWLSQQLRAQDGAAEAVSTAELMARWFPRLKYIFLWRRDTARQAISYYRACVTKVWFLTGEARRGALTGEVDYQQIRWFEDILVEHREKWRAYFAEHGVIPLEVIYEDLAADPCAILRKVLADLGLAEGPELAAAPTMLLRQSDDRSEAILEAYLAVRESLRPRPGDLIWSAEDTAFRSPSLSAGTRPGPRAAGRGERGAVAPISFEWQRWAAFSLMSGVSTDSVIASMASQGMDRAAVAGLCRELMASPAYAAGDWMSQRLRKLESTMDVLRALRRTGGVARSVDRRSELGREDFLREFYAANTPVLLADVAPDWPALTKWSPEYFASVMGDEAVEVMGDRDADPDYERRVHAHRRKIPLREYVERVASGAPSNDMYLVANNHLLESGAAASLWDDFTIDQRYLEPGRAKGSAFLWFGPRGTFTPLHHDVLNILFVQVFGSKRVTLISPLESHCMSNHVGVHSDVDARAPDPVRFPRFASTEQISLTVGPGEALFIPVGWWHCVEALTTSISLSFTNFAYQNSYHWLHPEIKF